jgi:5-hydroxyisourate hydrolase-like protein (transthyretin family)
VLGSRQSRVRKLAVAAVIATLATAPSAPAHADDTASISGTLVVADTGLPADHGCVSAFDAETYDWLAEACTEGDGTFSITGLRAGSYKLRFIDYNGTYVNQWYDGKASFSDADVVEVADGAAEAGIDFKLHPAAWIHGTVTDRATGDPIEGICPDAWRVDGESAPVAEYNCTNDMGEYALRGLPVGDYKVRFGSSGSYLEQWAVSKPDEESADVIHATVEGTLLNDQLTRGAVISGTVTDAASGVPLTQVCGSARRSADGEFGAGWGCTDEDGHYTMSAVAPGMYHFEFIDETGAHVIYRAGPVDVPGDITYDVAMSAGGTLTGVIADARTGHPVGDACVELYDAASGDQVELFNSGCMSSGGRYKLRAVPPGQYKVRFSPDYRSEYVASWLGASSSRPPTVITVTDGQTLAVDGTVPKGGVISGRVRDAATGEPLADVCVTTGFYIPRADETGDSDKPPSCTGADGTYAIKGLPTGRYKVQFYDKSDEHAWQFFPGQPDRAAAQWISVKVEGVKTGIDANLPKGGSVSGTITDAVAGEPIQWVCVDTVSARTGHPIGMTTCSDAEGHYSARGLPTTSVKLFFMHDTESPQYVEQWAFGKPDKESADPVATEAATDVDGVDISMVAAG